MNEDANHNIQDIFIINDDVNDDVYAEKCCTSCSGVPQKYYSIDKVHNKCGECCMDPKYYDIYKIFEPGLTKAD